MTPTYPAPRLVLFVCVALITIAGLSLATGRDLGHQMTLDVCSTSGHCGNFPDSPPVCAYFGRDRVVAQESFIFAQQRAGAGTRLIQFGDDSAELIVGAEKGQKGAVYSFAHWQDAQRWVMDEYSDLGDVISAAAGPTGSPVREGYREALQLLGLDHEIDIEASTGVRIFDDALLPGATGALRGAEGEAVSEVTVVVPFDAASDQLLELTHSMGFWDVFSYTIELDSDLQPVSLTFSGPAADGWSLQSLRAPSEAEFRKAEDRPLLGAAQSEIYIRSFTLDLQREANAALYRDMFSMEPIRQVSAAAPLLSADERLAPAERRRLYEQMRERIRDDAVALEVVHGLTTADGNEDAIQQAAHGLMLRSGPVAVPATRLVDARTADLSVAGSQLDPLMTCEPDSAAKVSGS